MKKVTISIIILLIVLILLGGGTLAYMYIATDIFKTDRELFYKYISQNTEIFEIFKDEQLISYKNKKQNTPYENNGKYYVKGMENYVPEQLIGFNVTFMGQTDKANKYTDQQIKLNYSEDTSITADYVNIDDYYGVKIEGILKKYLTIENNNLKELAQKLGETDLTYIPDKIDFETVKSNTKYTEEEIEEIKSLIKTTLDDNLTDEMFISSETIDGKKYQLNLTASQATNIKKQILEKFSNNELIMNRIKQIYQDENNATEEQASQYIEELKEEINDYANNEVEEETNISIIVYVQDKKLIKTELNIYSTTDEDEKYNIILNKGTNNLVLEVQSYEAGEFIEQASINIEKIKENDKIEYKLSYETNDDVKIALSMKWDGIQTLEKINEQYILEMDIDTEQIQYILTNQNTFKQVISEKVQDKELEIINEYDSEKLTNTMEKLGTALEQLDKQKMKEIGLEEERNVILYYIPVLSIYVANTNELLKSEK